MSDRPMTPYDPFDSSEPFPLPAGVPSDTEPAGVAPSYAPGVKDALDSITARLESHSLETLAAVRNLTQIVVDNFDLHAKAIRALNAEARARGVPPVSLVDV